MTKITPKYVLTENARKRLYICWSTVLIHFNECHMLSSHSYPFFLSLTPHISNFFHQRYSTVNNIDFVIYPTIQNHPPVSSYERGEKRGEVEEVEEKKKKKREEESIPARTRTKKRDRYLHSRDLKYPEAFRIRYLTLSGSLSALLTPLLSTASLSVGLECTALAYTRLELGFEELYPGPEISFYGPQVPSFVVDLPCNRRKKKRHTENREKIPSILSYYIACRCAVKRVRAQKKARGNLVDTGCRSVSCQLRYAVGGGAYAWSSVVQPFPVDLPGRGIQT